MGLQAGDFARRGNSIEEDAVNGPRSRRQSALVEASRVDHRNPRQIEPFAKLVKSAAAAPAAIVVVAGRQRNVKLPFDQRHAARPAAVRKYFPANVRRHQPGVEVPGTSGARHKGAVARHQTSARQEVLYLQPLPAKDFAQRPQQRHRISVSLDGPDSKASDERHA
jgi:hypothetical protein